ncbi:MAG: 50S ribosomal protein L10 [Holosporaceae bacterium]|nr:50S ribosomal protein L10 [Holosporaceae bacterium]
MEKSKKSEIIAKLVECFSGCEAAFLVNQDRMTVAETEDLRRRLKAASSSYFVAKNTLIQLALNQCGLFEWFRDNLLGQSALVFSKNVTEAAKIISELAAKGDGKMRVVCGGHEGRALSPAEVKMLGQLPSMDELRSRIIAVVQTPAQRLAALLVAPAGKITRVIRCYSEK